MSEDKIINKTSLIDYINLGNQVEYLLFWKYRSNESGSIDKSAFFRQCFGARFEIDGIYYPTVEHYTMISKARLFEDIDAEQNILNSKQHPNEATQIGRRIKGFNEKIWIEHCSNILIRGNLAKFAQNELLKEFILSTKNLVIAEANPEEQILGIGLTADNPDAKNPYKWRGLNLLGFALMEVRERLIRGC
jgi:ribA/ribD-fused uncharacterized protein